MFLVCSFVEVKRNFYVQVHVFPGPFLCYSPFTLLFFLQLFPSGVCTANHPLLFDPILFSHTHVLFRSIHKISSSGFPQASRLPGLFCQCFSGGKICRLCLAIPSCGHVQTTSFWPLRPHIHCPSDALNPDPVHSAHSQREAQHFHLH